MNEAPTQTTDNEDAQLFHESANVVARVSILSLIILVIVGVAVFAGVYYSPAYNRQHYVGIPIEQPVQFSHQHHVSGLGIDCRYCHTSVEQSSFAGIPPTHTCMSCHSQVWTQSPLLEPVRQSYSTNQPILWNRVHNLPDFVYFNHGIHVQKGVGCATCHGPVQEMTLVYQAESLSMGWCLGCHRAPEWHLRPREEVFNMEWSLPEAEQLALGQQLIEEYDIRIGYLTECYVCHR